MYLLQVSEVELEAIARMGDAATLEAELAAGAGGEATRQLLGDYQTPARWARGCCSERYNLQRRSSSRVLLRLQCGKVLCAAYNAMRENLQLCLQGTIQHG